MMIDAWFVSSKPVTKVAASSQVWHVKTGLPGLKIVSPKAIRRFIQQSGKQVFTLAG